MRYQAIIFDMDGTISDSEKLWDKAIVTFLARYNVIMTQKDFDELSQDIVGTTLTAATELIKDKFALDGSINELKDELAECARALISTDVEFIENFLDFHATLDAHNMKYGIATNADNATLFAIKEALSLDKLFGEHIYNVSHVKQGKPEPDIYLYAAEKLQISPYACIAIEDSACGIKSAKAANMFCIGINTHGIMSQLAEADMIINSYKDIDLAKLLY